jgi:hypothetical protein
MPLFSYLSKDEGLTVPILGTDLDPKGKLRQTHEDLNKILAIARQVTGDDLRITLHPYGVRTRWYRTKIEICYLLHIVGRNVHGEEVAGSYQQIVSTTNPEEIRLILVGYEQGYVAGTKDTTKNIVDRDTGEHVKTPSAIRLARSALHTAFVWNDHNFTRHPKELAKEVAVGEGITTFEQANEWLEKHAEIGLFTVKPSSGDPLFHHPV